MAAVIDDIQQMLDREFYLRAENIIDYIAAQWDASNRILTADDFCDMITGVFNRKKKRLSNAEFEDHRRKLWDSGVFAGSDLGTDCFLSISRNFPPAPRIRFYINAANAECSRNIVKSIVDFKGERYKIKTVGKASDGFQRYDNTVLYVHKTHARIYMNFLKQLPQEWFDYQVPITSRKIGRGIGYASSIMKREQDILGIPFDSSNASFNELHSRLIERVFHIAIDQQISELEKITCLYRQGLAEAGINPEKPYLRSDLLDIL